MVKIIKTGAIFTLLLVLAECTPFEFKEDFTLESSFPDNPVNLHYTDAEKKILMDFEEVKSNRDKDAARKTFQENLDYERSKREGKIGGPK